MVLCDNNISRSCPGQVFDDYYSCALVTDHMKDKLFRCKVVMKRFCKCKS